MITLLATSLLSACGTTQGIDPTKLSTPIADGYSRITVKRDTSMLYFSVPVNVDVNGNRSASLGRGGAMLQDIPAGQNKISVSVPSAFGKYTVHLLAKEGETYHFVTAPRPENLMGGYGAGLLGDVVKASQSENSGYFGLELAQ